MSVPRTQSDQIDIAEAFGFVFRSRNWFGRLAVGALCLLFFWALFIPVFILMGYFVETARAVSRGERELPPWINIGQKLREGFLLAVALFIWNLPGTVLSGSGIHCTGSTCTSSGTTGLGTLYSILLGLLTAAIWSQFLESGFTGAFDFRAIFRRALMNPGMTVIVWLMVIVANIIGGLGVILLVVGVLFTLPYAFAVTSHLYGQFRQRTAIAANPTTPLTREPLRNEAEGPGTV